MTHTSVTHSRAHSVPLTRPQPDWTDLSGTRINEDQSKITNPQSKQGWNQSMHAANKSDQFGISLSCCARKSMAFKLDLKWEIDKYRGDGHLRRTATMKGGSECRSSHWSDEIGLRHTLQARGPTVRPFFRTWPLLTEAHKLVDIYWLPIFRMPACPLLDTTEFSLPPLFVFLLLMIIRDRRPESPTIYPRKVLLWQERVRQPWLFCAIVVGHSISSLGIV